MSNLIDKLIGNIRYQKVISINLVVNHGHVKCIYKRDFINFYKNIIYLLFGIIAFKTENQLKGPVELYHCTAKNIWKNKWRDVFRRITTRGFKKCKICFHVVYRL